MNTRKRLMPFDVGMGNPGWGLAMLAAAMFAMIAIVPRLTSSNRQAAGCSRPFYWLQRLACPD